MPEIQSSRFAEILRATGAESAPTPSSGEIRSDRFKELLAAQSQPQSPPPTAPPPTVTPVIVGEKQQDYRGKAFSGGFLSDVVDALSVGQYAAAGILAGKGPIQGIRDRTSYEEVLQNAGMAPGAARTVLGLAADIVLDPAWLVTPAKIGGLLGKVETISKIGAAMKETKAAKFLGRGLVFGFNTPDEVKGARILGDAFRGEVTHELVANARKIEKRGKEFEDLLVTYMEASPGGSRTAVLKAAATKGYNPTEIRELASSTRGLYNKVTNTLVKEGVMRAPDVQRISGPYARLIGETPGSIAARLDQLGLKEASDAATKLRAYEAGMTRTDRKIFALSKRIESFITPQMAQTLASISPIGQRVTKAVAEGASFAAEQHFVNSLAKFAIDNPKITAGLERLPLESKYGELAGKWLDKDIHSFVMQTFRKPYKIEDFNKNWLPLWKMSKTIFSPGSQMRNLYGNAILNIFNGVPAHRLPDLYYKAGKALIESSKGLNTADETVKLAGLISARARTFSRTELNDYLLRMMSGGRSLPSMFKAMGTKAIDTAGRAFEFNEILGKTVAGIWAMEKTAGAKLYGSLVGVKRGLGAAEAAAFGDKVLFNYAQVPGAVEFLRSSGLMPFASFAYFAGRTTAEALWKHPTTVTQVGKTIRAIEARNPDALAERRAAPSYMKTFGQMFTPIRDKYGRHLVADLSYLIPFGNFVGSVDSPRQLLSNLPFVTFAYDLANNRSTFTGNEISKPGFGASAALNKKAIRDYTDYIYKFAFPSLMPSILPGFKEKQQLTTGGYGFRNLEDAISQRPDVFGKTKSWKAQVLGEVFGLKTRPLDLARERSFRAKDFRANMDAVRAQIRRVALDRDLSPEEKNQMITDLANDMTQLSRQFMVGPD